LSIEKDGESGEEEEGGMGEDEVMESVEEKESPEILKVMMGEERGNSHFRPWGWEQGAAGQLVYMGDCDCG